MKRSNARIKGKVALGAAYCGFAIITGCVIASAFFDLGPEGKKLQGYIGLAGFGLAFGAAIFSWLIRCENCKTWLSFYSPEGDTVLEPGVDDGDFCPKCGIERR